MTTAEGEPGDRFTLHLDSFQSRCDLLLHLIAKHELGITEVALEAELAREAVLAGPAAHQPQENND